MSAATPAPPREVQELFPEVGVICRFAKGAPAEAKAEFAKCLMVLLDAVGVEPGEAFIVARRDRVEAYVDDRLGEMKQELHEAGVRTSEAVRDYEAMEREMAELAEQLLDVERGILTFEELKERYCS